MSSPIKGYVVVALATAAISVGATLVVVDRGNHDVRVTAANAARGSKSVAEGTTTSSVLGTDDPGPATVVQPANLAPATVVRTPVPVVADGCSGATDEPLHGDVVGINTPDGVEEVSLDGSRRFRVDGPTAQNSSPSWSADGRFVAFNVGMWQDQPRPSLGIADVASHCWKVWPRGGDTFIEPSLSNDGSKVIYTVGLNGSAMGAATHAEIADADGGHRVRLADRAAGGAAWSPDGSGRFAYSDGQGLKVRDRTGRTTLLDQVSDSESPSWSPDATRVAYSVSTNAGVWVANADGTGHHEVLPGVAEIFWMSWSPDGKDIAYNRNGRLFIVSADGGAPREVLLPSGMDGTPWWTLDGNSILYTEGTPGGSSPTRVIAVPANGGAARLVADNARLVTVFHRN